MDPQTPPVFTLSVPRVRIPRFVALFGQGISVPVRTGCPLQDVLCEDLGFSETYVTEQIQTIFRNGKAVDDPKRVLVANGDRVALSAAMPGLVGAAMRKGGRYAVLRSAITHDKASETCTGSQNGTIRLKLFNMVAREHGERLLASGVWVDAEVFKPLLADMAQDGENRHGGEINGESVPLGRLIDRLTREEGPVMLRVIPAS